MASTRWTPQEERACARLYVSMVERVESGERLNKAAMIRAAREGVLRDRSRGSVEFKLMNCTTWALKLGLPVVVGYAPAGNAAGSLGGLLRDAFAKRGTDSEAGSDAATARLATLNNRTEYSDHLNG